MRDGDGGDCRAATDQGAALAIVTTATGGRFDLANPRAEAISLDDIFTSLGRLCRFNGHLPGQDWIYTVADHCCLCVALARDRWPEAGAGLLAAVLLHDAAEAYTGDQIRPLRQLVPQLVVVETAIMAAIAERFAVDFTDARIWEVDNLALALECDLIRRGEPGPWVFCHSSPTVSLWRTWEQIGHLHY